MKRVSYWDFSFCFRDKYTVLYENNLKEVIKMEIIGWGFIVMVIGFFISLIYSISNDVIFVEYDENEIFEEE